MAEIECPKCGRLGNVPKDKLNSRLVCKKCLAIFHLTPAGRTVVGEPPDPANVGHAHTAAATATRKHDAVDVIADFSLGRTGVLVGVLAAGLVGILCLFLFSEGSSQDFLQFKASMVADAVANDDINLVMKNTAKEGAADANQWVANIGAILSQMKKESANNKLTTLVLVMEEDLATKQGQVEIAYLQVKGNTHAEEIAKEAGSKTSGRTSLTVPVFWVNQGGRWLLDGTKTLDASSKIH